MDRRTFLAGTGAVLLTVPLAAEAQQGGKVKRVGLLTTASTLRDAFVSGLHELGYVEGSNIAIDWRRSSESGGPDLEDLIRLKLDCLLLTGPNVARGQKLTTTIPIVAIDLESDPVASGLIASLAHPGGNVTGIFMDFPELAGKQIQLLRESVPMLARLAVLWEEGAGEPQLRAAHVAARAAGVSLVPIGVRATGDLDSAVPHALKSRPQALLVLTSRTFFLNRDRIAVSALRHRLPLASIFPEFAVAGGLLGYGPNLAELYKQAAKYVDRVLKGTLPANLPVERPTKFELVINLKTAKALGLTIPQSLLQRADELIQ